MIISVNWLKKYLNVDFNIQTLAERIGTRLVEIESIEDLTPKYKGAVIVKVVSCVDHPDSDHMHVCRVDDAGVVQDAERDNDGLVQVVCGAPNVRADMLAVWLPPKSVVPESYGTNDEFVLGSRKLRGVMSHGMLASPRELGLWNEHNGIFEVTGDAKAGQKLSDYLALDDCLLEVENKSLTHRPDCFGVVGFAREVAAIFDSQLKTPDWLNDLNGVVSVDSMEVKPSVTIADSDLCARYECVALANVDSSRQLPDLMRSLIGRVGTNSISAPVDITNYLMFESGQPLHAFDLDKVIAVSPTSSADIVIRAAQKGEKLELLDGRTIELDPADIVVAAGTIEDSVPIALAGAMGGMATEITPSTKRVLLESATFDLYHLRGTQFRHGIFSEAITRFTKGQPADLARPVLLRAAQMMQQYAGATVISDIASDSVGKSEPTKFDIPTERFTAVLGQYNDNGQGVDYSSELIVRTLQNLQYDAVKASKGHIQAVAPWWRTDLHIDEDVIEDLGRVTGFDNILPVSPLRRYVAAPYDPLYEKQNLLRERLKEAGGNEVITYSFIHGDLLDGVHDDKSAAYRIVNAISPGLQYYRRDLLPNLIERTRDNLRAGYNNFMLFEIGKVHRRGYMDQNEPDLPVEFPEVSGIIADKVKHLDSAYYTAKYVVGYMLGNLASSISYTRLDKYDGNLDSSTNVFEPQRSAVLTMANGDYVGVVGELKTDVLNRYKLPTFTAGFSLMIDALLDGLGQVMQYTPVLRYQGTSRDITYQVDKDTDYDKVYKLTRKVLDTKAGDNIVATVTPKDIYDTGDNLRNITLHIEFHDRNATINSKYVNKIMDRLAKQAANELNVKVI